MMDRTRPWTEQEGLGSAGSSVAAPPKSEGLPASAACWAVRVLLAFLTHGSRLSFGGPACHRAPSAVSSGPGLKCLHALKMGRSFTDSPEPHSPVGLSLPRAQHGSHASRAERGAALSEPRLRSCVCFPRTGAGGEGEAGQSRSEKAAGPRAPARPLFAVGCHVLAGTYQFISGKNKEDHVSTATSSVLPPESTKRAKASSPCLSASACSLPRVGTARSRQRGGAPRGPSPWSSS